MLEISRNIQRNNLIIKTYLTQVLDILNHMIT